MDRTADLGLTWHLVGHLQSNKARRAAERFAMIHSVDSAALLARLEEAFAFGNLARTSSMDLYLGDLMRALQHFESHVAFMTQGALKRVLWPYWEDATRPVHVPKEFPPDMDDAEQARTYAEWRRRLFGAA